MKERIFYCLIVFGFFHIPTRTQAASCDPAEEGSRHDIFYQVTSQQMKDVKWFQRQGNSSITLASCTFVTENNTFTCNSTDPSKYEIQENNNNFTLTILSVSSVGLTPYFFTVSGDASPQYTCNLTVYDQATIQTFTANQNQTLTVDLHDSINLTCVTDGNPTPTIIIQNHRATDKKTGEGHRLTYVKDSVTCSDTANYTCQVTNYFTSMEESSKAHVQVFVKCPQQRQDEDNTVFSASVGDTVTLDLDVIGYPAPRSYTLERKQKLVAQVNTTDGNGESGTYQFKYLSNDPPFGKVQLTIGNLGQEHFTNYLLTIDNGVGQALEYNFVLETAVSDTEDDDDIAVIVGVPFGIAVLVVAVIMLLVLKRQEMLIICADFRKRSDYAKKPTVETAPADFQRSRPASTIYDNAVPPSEPTNTDSHSPDEN